MTSVKIKRLTLVARLGRLASEKRVAEVPTRIYYGEDGLYLSGGPPIWTTFIERAFVFDFTDAERLLWEYADELKGCELLADESKLRPHLIKRLQGTFTVPLDPVDWEVVDELLLHTGMQRLHEMVVQREAEFRTRVEKMDRCPRCAGRLRKISGLRPTGHGPNCPLGEV